MREGDRHPRGADAQAALDELFERLQRRLGEGEAQALSLRNWVDLAEAWRIVRALRECDGNRSAAARALGIGRRTLYAKMEKLRIAPTFSAWSPSGPDGGSEAS